ncbi:MAG: hypothetical protein KY475_09750 [Planctomycetes bacterium]|nr:hypothetical protein [Planctomycetota bacterium]
MQARRVAPAWLMSVVTHLTLALVLAFTVRAVPRGAAVEPDRTAGIALVQNVRGERDYFREPGDSSEQLAATDSAAPPSAAEALPSADRPPIEIAGLLPSGDESLASAAELGDAIPGADGFTAGPARSKDFGGGVQTEVFGVQGNGTKFVYVFDRSSSMNGFEGRPLAAAKRELIASLADLAPVHQFQIVFYNDRITVCNPNPGLAPKLLYGNDRDRQAAADFVRSITGAGGTRHFEPLMTALRMGPDVIFFLTDAEEPSLSADELAKIRAVNRRHEASIHTVEFGVGPFRGEENFLVKLARQNHGRHAYVDVTRLPAGP